MTSHSTYDEYARRRELQLSQKYRKQFERKRESTPNLLIFPGQLPWDMPRVLNLPESKKNLQLLKLDFFLGPFIFFTCFHLRTSILHICFHFNIFCNVTYLPLICSYFLNYKK